MVGRQLDLAATQCHRSDQAAAAEAARRLKASWPVQFHSFACSGGVTGAMAEGDEVSPVDDRRTLLTPRGQFETIRRMLGSARPIDALVLSIGGNDIDFADIVTDCVAPFNSCHHRYGEWTAYRLSQLPERLNQVVAAVNNGRAGNVRHAFLVQYPDPTTFPVGRRCGEGGDDEMNISREEAEWASTSVVAPLNALLFDAVQEANRAQDKVAWHLVSGVVEEFRDHGYCAGYERFINTMADSNGIQGDLNGTMHPNSLGQRAIANAVTNAMWFLAQPQAEYVSQIVPTIMMAGQTYRVSITVRNTGTITWMARDNVRLGSQAWENNNVWGRSRVELPGDVAPGQSGTFSFDVTAPSYQGYYAFQWRMLREFVQWFGDFTPRENVFVQSPNRQMSLQVVENAASATAATITVHATESGTTTPVSGSILRNGSVVGQTGQPFTYQRERLKVCEPNQKGYLICHYEPVEQTFVVTAPGYDPASFTRY